MTPACRSESSSGRRGGAWFTRHYVACFKNGTIKIGYDVDIMSGFYKPQPKHTLEEIGSDILAIEKEGKGLLDGLRKGAMR